MLQVTGDLPVRTGALVSEATASFLAIVAPMRAEFTLDPRTGDLVGRRPRLLERVLQGLAALGCVHGHALVTPAARGVPGADTRLWER